MLFCGFGLKQQELLKTFNYFLHYTAPTPERVKV